MAHSENTRRNFIKSITGAGAALILSPVISFASESQEAKVKRIVSKTIGIDAHNHMDLPYSSNEFKVKNYDIAKQFVASGLTAIGMTFCVDRPLPNTEEESYDRFLTILSETDELLQENNLIRALNYDEIIEAAKDHRQVVIQSVEGCHFIGTDMTRLQSAYDRGLRHLGLMHDGQSTPPVGDIYTDNPQFGGLTDFGIDIIKECNRLGILIDLAHCNQEAIEKAIQISKTPMLISHTGLNTRLGSNSKMGKMMFPRLISPENAKFFAKSGGVIGVWTHLAETPLEYAENVKEMVDIIGIEHVCIGTDTQIAPSSEGQNKFTHKTNQSWKDNSTGFYYTVVDALLKTGFSESDIAKIGGENYLNLFKVATTI